MIKELSGPQERTKKREGKKKEKRKKIIKQVNEVLLNTKSNIIINNKTVFDLMHKIFSENKMPLNIYANNYIREIIIDGIKKKKWYLNIPQSMTRPKKKPHFRSDKFFIKAKILSTWLVAWNQDQAINLKNENNIIASLIISATTYGGLNIKEGLASLMNQLINDAKPLYEANQVTWIDLIIYDKKFPSNYIIGETKVHLRRWYPDSNTLMWINNYLLNKNRKIKFTEISLWKVVSNYMDSVSLKHQLDIGLIKSLNDLCDSGILITERLKGVRLNQAITGFARGDYHSVSLRPEFLEGVLKNEYPLVDDTIDCDLIKVDSLVIEETTEEKVEDIPFFDLLKKATYYNKEKNKKKPSKNKVIKLLNSFEPNTDCESYLHDWLIYNLVERKNKVGTAYKYLHRAGKIWLKADSEGVNIFNEVELENFLNISILGKSNEEKTCLNRLLEYCIVNFGIPKVSTFHNLEKSDNLVRAGFISEKLYFELIQKINKSSQRSQDIGMLICFFIFAYRTGLRLTEIKKLRIRDIEDSDGLWIYVRPNQHEDNKTFSGYRKFNLGVLLTKNEYTYVRKYIKFKKLKPNVNLSSLLFSYDLSPSQMISDGLIYKNFRMHFSKKYDLSFVFHLMRHTALNKLFIIFSNNKYLITKLTCYSDKQIKIIQKNFNFKGKNSYYNLAALAGHSSPDSTFQNYIHFCDYLLYSELNKHKRHYSFKQLENLTGCNRQYLSYHINNKRNNRGSIPLNRIKNILSKSLKQFSTNIKTDNKTNKEPQHEFTNKPTSIDCYLALKEIEDNKPVDYISREYLDKWIKNAKYLSSLKTGQGMPSLFSGNKIIPKSGCHLAPVLPNTLYEINIAKTNILDKAEDVYRQNKNAFKEALNYYVHNSTYTVSGLSFKDPEQLDGFLDVLQHFFKKKHITILVKTQKGFSKTKQFDVWKTINGKVKIDKRATYKNSKLQHYQIKNYQFGEARLFIKNPDAEVAIARQKKSKEVRDPKNLIAKQAEVKEFNEKLKIVNTTKEAEELSTKIDKAEKLIVKLKGGIELAEKLKEVEELAEKLKEANETKAAESLKTELKKVKKEIVKLKKGKDETIYSSNLLKFTFHLLAIMVLDFTNKKITTIQNIS